jgi:hypothetical protein
MSDKLRRVTRDILVNAPLPPATDTYTVIGHQYAITTIMQALEENGFEIESEEYRAIGGAKVATGTFIINYGGDPDLAMTYTFGNSYDKSYRFRATVGALNRTNKAFLISNMDFWRRKHTGTADTETEELINTHISNAKDYFAQLKHDKEMMMKIEINKEEFGRIIGQLYIDGYLNVEQFSMAAREYFKPSFQYTTGENNLWTCYNHIVYALKQTHPAKWLQCQAAVHMFIAAKFNLGEFDAEVEDLTEEEELDVQLPIQGEEEVEEKSAGPKVIINKVSEEEAVEEDPFKSDKELEEEGITVVNSTEETPEMTKAEEGEYPADWDTEEDTANESEPVAPIVEEPVKAMKAESASITYLDASDFDGVEEGDTLEVEGKFYEIKGSEEIDGALYLKATEIVIEAITPESEATAEEETVEETPIVSESQPVAKEVTVKPEAQGALELDFDDVAVAEEEPVKEEPQKVDDPIREKIKLAAEEMYDDLDNFTYECKDGQYNVKLSTGESFVLSKPYVDAL